MSGRLIAIFGGISVAIVAVVVGTSTLFYHLVLDERRHHLLETVQHHAELLESLTPVALFNTVADRAEHAAAAMQLRQLLGSAEEESERLLVGDALGTAYRVLATSDAQAFPAFLPPGLAESDALRQALEGRSGTLIARGYGGSDVLAAYAPIPSLNLALVQEIPLWPLRQPFVIGGVLASFVLTGLFWLLTVPVLRLVPALVRGLRETEQHALSIASAVTDAVLTVSAAGRILAMNEAGARMLGFSEYQLRGESIRLVLPELPVSESGGFEATENGGATSQLRETSGRGADGRRFPVELTCRTSRWRGLDVRVCLLRELSQVRHTEDVLRRHNETARLLREVAVASNAASEPDAAVASCLKAVCALLQWPVGHFYVTDAKNPNVLSPTDLWHMESPGGYPALQHITRQTRLPRGVGLPGRVLKSGEPEWIEDVTAAPDYVRVRVGEDLGVRAGLAFPVKVGDRVVGVLEFYSPQAQAPDAALLAMLPTVGVELGRVFERHASAQEIRTSEARLREAHRIAHLGHWDSDLQAGTLTWSDEVYHIFGLVPDTRSMDYSSFLNFVHSDDRETVQRAAFAARRGEGPYLSEHRIVRADGSERIVMERAEVQLDGEGAPLHMSGTVQDITEMRQAEEALRAQQTLLRSVIDALPQQFFVKDTEGRFLLVNRAWAEYHNIAAEDCTQFDASSVPLHDETLRAQIIASDQQVFETGERLVVLRREERRGGRLYLWRMIKVPLYDAQGKLIGLTGFTEDVTERRLTEDALEEHRKLLDTVINAIPEHLFVKDRDGRFMLANRAWCEDFGIDAARVRDYSTHTLPLANDEIRRSMLETDREVLDTGLITDRVHLVPMPDGRERLRRLIKVPLHGAQGEVAGLVGLSIDITEQTRAEEEVEAQRNLLRTVIDALPEFVFVKDKAGRYLVANRAWKERFGIEGQDVRQYTADLLLPTNHEQRRKMRETDAEVMESGSTVDMVHTVLYEDGTENTRRLIKVPLRDALGEVSGIVGLSIDITEQKRAEEAMEAQRNLLRTVIDALPQQLAVKDRDGRFLLVNSSWSESNGIKQVDVAGMTVSTMPLVDEAVRAVLIKTDQEVLEQGKEVHQQEVESLDAGERRILCISKVPLRGIQGEVTGMVALTEDITERHKSREAARATQRLLETVFRTIPHTLSVKDFEGRYLMLNPAWGRQFGIAPEEALGLTVSEIDGFTGDDVEAVQANDRDVMASNLDRVEFETERQGQKDGARKIHLIKALLRDELGRVSGVLSMGIDITPRVEAEAELRASEERFRNLIEGSVQGIVIHRKGRMLFVNPRFASTFGFDSPEQMLEHGDLEPLIDPEDLDLVAEQNRLALRKEEPTPFRVRCRTPEGKLLTVEIYNRLVNWQGEPAIQSTTVDITWRTEMEQQLRQAQKMEAVGQLAGGVAHDFNNVLQIVRGYADLAQHSLAGKRPERLGGHLDKVLQAAESGSHLVRQLLAFSRREVLQPRALDLNQLVEKSASLIKRLIGENIDLKLEPGLDVPQVHADPGMLEQVLFNLCVNARDAMPMGGSLTLQTDRTYVGAELCEAHGLARSGDYARVRVIDTGGGIAPDDLLRVFEPFFTTKSVEHGTGLGLSTAYGIIKQHDGAVLVQSELGHGTEFTLLLPATTQAMTDESAEVLVRQAPAGGSETVLVAEDDSDVLALVREVLRSQGYQVIEAEDGEAALRQFEAHQAEISLAILDVVMPKLGGRDVFTKIKERRPQLPVMFSTGYASDYLDPEFLKVSGTSVLRKPYSPEALLRAVREVLDATREQPPAPKVAASLN